MAAEDDVRQASARFYAALTQMLRGAAGPMAEVWSHEADVTTMHPLGGRQVGWAQVRPTWEQVAQLAGGGQARLDDQLVRVGGDLAYEVGTERGQVTLAGDTIPFEERVTNIYRREAGGGRWCTTTATPYRPCKTWSVACKPSRVRSRPKPQPTHPSHPTRPGQDVTL